MPSLSLLLLLLSVSGAFHWSEGRCSSLYRNRRRAHYTEANFAIPAISAPVPLYTAQALLAAAGTSFRSRCACLPASACPFLHQTPSHAVRPPGGGRGERDWDRDQTRRDTTTGLCLSIALQQRAQARRLRLQPLDRRRTPRLVPPRPSVAPFAAHTTACSKPPAIASLVAL